MLLIKPSSSPIVHHKDVGSVSQITGKDWNFNALKIVLVLYEEIFEQLKHFPSAGCEEERAGSKSVMFQLWSDRAGKATTADTPAHVSEVIWGKIAESTTPLQDVSFSISPLGMVCVKIH